MTLLPCYEDVELRRYKCDEVERRKKCDEHMAIMPMNRVASMQWPSFENYFNIKIYILILYVFYGWGGHAQKPQGLTISAAARQ